MIFVHIVLFTFAISFGAKAEWFSSLGHMEDLVHEESKLIDSLQDYISAEQAKLDQVKQLAKDLKARAETVENNVDNFLGHPVNQYHLMRRLSAKWESIANVVKEDVSHSFLTNLTSRENIFPDDEDVKGTAQAIMRLQDTYLLDTHELAKGIVKGSKARDRMSLDDVFNIGRTAYLDLDYYHCALWMREAQSKKISGEQGPSLFEILDHLAYCLAQQGNLETAYQLTYDMLKIDPMHTRIKSNHHHYKNILSARKKGDDGAVVLEKLGDQLQRSDHVYKFPEYNLYERLCREGGDPIPPRKEKKLTCFYWTNNNPWLLIQPVKAELMWKGPDLVRFYNIISDNEIEFIKSVAKPRLNRATVQNPVTGRLESADYRVSKSAWLKDQQYETVKKISHRISAVTGLSMETAEELQIANYGVGGQYEPHYDYARNTDSGRFDDEQGNRIATWLFYFTDVEHGGATAFLYPKLAVRPIKGSAVFWYNILPSGDGDERTRHAACPVLIGVKWVGNKWIHERGQEFIKKCKLTREAESSL